MAALDTWPPSARTPSVLHADPGRTRFGDSWLRSGAGRSTSTFLGGDTVPTDGRAGPTRLLTVSPQRRLAVLSPPPIDTVAADSPLAPEGRWAARAWGGGRAPRYATASQSGRRTRCEGRPWRRRRAAKRGPSESCERARGSNAKVTPDSRPPHAKRARLGRSRRNGGAGSKGASLSRLRASGGERCVRRQRGARM